MVTLRVSEPSVSVRADWISKAIAVSSFPSVSVVSRAGASATACTVMSAVAVVTAVCPVVSIAVAVTPREIVPLKFSGGVRARPERSAGASVQVPSPLSVPPDSCAPSGTPEIMMESVSLPSVSVKVTPRSSDMASSSFPVVLENTTAGAWATGVNSASPAAALGTDWEGRGDPLRASCSSWFSPAAAAFTALSRGAGAVFSAAAGAGWSGRSIGARVVAPAASPSSVGSVRSPLTGWDERLREDGVVSSPVRSEGVAGGSNSTFP